MVQIGAKSKHIKASKERYILGQNTTCKFSGQSLLSRYKMTLKQQFNGEKWRNVLVLECLQFQIFIWCKHFQQVLSLSLQLLSVCCFVWGIHLVVNVLRLRPSSRILLLMSVETLHLSWRVTCACLQQFFFLSPPQKAVCFFLTKMGQAGSDQLQSWHFQLVSIIPSAKTVVWNAVCFIYMASQHGFFRKLSPRKHTEMKLLTFELHFFQGTIDNITFFKMSNNHMADDVNTILCVVIG